MEDRAGVKRVSPPGSSSSSSNSNSGNNTSNPVIEDGDGDTGDGDTGDGDIGDGDIVENTASGYVKLPAELPKGEANRLKSWG